MAWWWVVLLLLLPPWLPVNPGMRAGGPGLWQWVALLSWLPGVHPCLFCFSRPVQRAQICRYITGAFPKDPEYHQCIQAIVQVALQLGSVTVGFDQIRELELIVVDALYFLEKFKDMGPLEVAMQETTDFFWEKLSHLEKAPECIPPCGYQPAARVFQCATCSIRECRLPLDCPAEDVRVHGDEVIRLRCGVSFPTPSNLHATWMFAKDVYTQDLALFEKLQEGPLRLTITDPKPGTIACTLGAPSAPVARKYFYLNVSERGMEEEQQLQARFRTLLHWPHVRTLPLNHMALLGLGLLLGSMVLILLLIGVFLTPGPCCTAGSHPRDTVLREVLHGSPGNAKRPDLRGSQTSHTPGAQRPPWTGAQRPPWTFK